MEDKKKNGTYEIIQVPEHTKVRFGISTDNGSYVPRHWHPALELICLLEGSLTVLTNGREEEFHAGQCVLISPNIPHSTKCLDKNRAILLQIPLSFMEAWIPHIGDYYFHMPSVPSTPQERTRQDRLKELLRQMQIVDDIRPPGYVLRFQSLLFELLFQLFHSYASRTFPDTVARNTRNLERLEPVLQYTKAHYRRPISIAEISGVACLEEGYFCRFFKKQMGMTFLEYQNQLRLSCIYQDLLSTDDTVAAILERHGFTNYKLFRRMFREQFGTTPSRLRKQSR